MASSNSSSISITLDDMDPSILKSDFVSQVAPQSLRITCYGSSSAKTPENYLQAARSLGYTLAKRGHVCINGAGPAGCMSAMNDGAVLGSGHIIGVIHEMFLVDNGYLEDGKQVNFDDVGTHKAFQTTNEETGLIREIVVAGGDDLQERKKLLVKTADALVVLPGGPGTWDELWEMACSRHLGLVSLPIVCVNVDNYYQPFRDMLDRAYQDDLIRLKPSEIVHFAASVEEAVLWCETEAAENAKQAKPIKFNRRSSALEKSSFYSPPPFDDFDSGKPRKETKKRVELGLAFAGGIALGAGVCLVMMRKH